VNAAALPPGPPAAWPLGSLPALRRGTLPFYRSLQREFGDLVRFHIGPVPAYLVSDPAAALRLLRADLDGLRRGFANQALRPFFGQGLFFSEGDAWRARREALQGSFSRARLARLDACVRRLAAGWLDKLRALPEGTCIDLHASVRELMLEISAEALLGAPHVLRHRGFIADLDALWLEADRRTNPLGRLNPLRAALFQCRLGRLRRAVTELLRAPPERDCLLADLLELRRAGAAELDEPALRDEVITFVLTAHECTTLAASAALYLTATPERSAALAAEARSSLGAEAVTSQHLPRLRLARSAVSEALRLFPPTWMLARQLERPAEVLGYALPSDALLLISPFLIQRHPAYWDQPEEFAPERFDAEVIRHAYLPFGLGPRTCIGRSLALQQAVMLCSLAHRSLRLSAQGSARLPLSPGLTLRPDGGFPVCVSPRD
jgi:enediyne biosynthesis protein E7